MGILLGNKKEQTIDTPQNLGEYKGHYTKQKQKSISKDHSVYDPIYRASGSTFFPVAKDNRENITGVTVSYIIIKSFVRVESLNILTSVMVPHHCDMDTNVLILTL